jgi:hypothetical protein
MSFLKLKTFFFLISQKIYKKAQRGTIQAHRKYARGSLKGRGEARKKIRITNYNWGKPSGC